MHRVLVGASGFQDLLRAENHGLPYRFDLIFGDGSWIQRRRSKKKFDLLRRIDHEIRKMLLAGEEVRSITQGVCFKFWESYFLGWLLYIFNRRAIVLTDRRILLLQIDRRGRPKTLRSQIRYPAIARARGGILGGMKMIFQNGEKTQISGVPRSDRKLIKRLIDRLPGFDTGTASRFGGKDELCPHCNAVVGLGKERCDQCGGAFKSAKRAGLRSLLLPGLGDYYMGHRKLATAEMFFAVGAWAILVVPYLVIFTPVEAVIAAGIVVLLVHVPDGVATWYLARLGVYPEGRTPHPFR